VGEDVTVPDPVPAFVTVSSKVAGIFVKLAWTDTAEVKVTWHVPVPEQGPFFQPANVDPLAGVAVNVTTVPAS
jgi:hypothetical protein